MAMFRRPKSSSIVVSGVNGGMAISCSAKLIFNTMANGIRNRIKSQIYGTAITARWPGRRNSLFFSFFKVHCISLKLTEQRCRLVFRPADIDSLVPSRRRNVTHIPIRCGNLALDDTAVGKFDVVNREAAQVGNFFDCALGPVVRAQVFRFLFVQINVFRADADPDSWSFGTPSRGRCGRGFPSRHI